MSFIAGLILKMLGWNITSIKPDNLRKAVIIMAPHTSNLDFIIGRLSFFKYRMKAKFLIKKESFTPVVGPILRKLGGVPLDRGHSQTVIKKVTRYFDRNDDFFLLITPEGTRKRVNHWKKGFYFIALTANVPIVLGFLDYSKKEGGIGKILYPTGDFEKDFKEIEDFYRTKTARYPENFNLTPRHTEQRVS